MEAIYNRIGRWDDATYGALWTRWLWECDPNAKALESCHDMNEMHALGILACLGEHPRAAASNALYGVPWNASTVGGPAIIHLHPSTPPFALSVRGLLDQLECMQLHWGPIIADWGPTLARRALRALMARLGDIAHHAYPIGMDNDVLDDMQHATPLNTELGVISRGSLRQGVCVLFALLRVCDVVEWAKPCPALPPKAVASVHGVLRQHHTEASIDTFNLLQQMMYLAPGQRLAYRTLFAGMYNDVSQVVYYHHPRFQRKPQIELARIPDMPINMLPLITQLLPEIPIVYDDDNHAPQLGANAEWGWLVCCGAIFLLEKTTIWSSAQLGPLVAHYLAKTGKSIRGVSASKKKKSDDDAAEEDDDDDEDDDNDEEEEAAPAAAGPLTASSHVRLL